MNALVRELTKRIELLGKIRSGLFKQQLALIDDPAKYKSALCTRRAGKSHVSCAALVHTAIAEPGTNGLYLALTRKSAKKIAWRPLRKMFKDLGVKVRENLTDLQFELENGSVIMLMGANDEGAAESIRGVGYALVVVDEAASYRHAGYLIDEVITPALADTLGTLLIIGTPSADFQSFFYAVTEKRSEGYTVHKWTLYDNPHMPDPHGFVRDLIDLRGWKETDARFMREFQGKWVKTDEELVYRFNRDRNVCPLPKHDLLHVMALDFGFNDAFTINVLGFNTKVDSNTYNVAHYKQAGLTVSAMGQAAARFRDEFNPICTTGDAGALGKTIVEDLNVRFGLNIEAADKRDKAAGFELVNSGFREKKLWICEGNEAVMDELEALRWVQSKSRRIEDPTQPNDLCDALLYAFRRSLAYTHRPKAEAPEPGTHAYEKAKEDAFLKKIESSYRTRNDTNWWEAC